MFKKDLVVKMAERMGCKNKEAEKALNAFTESVVESLLEGEEVVLRGFGKFEVKQRAAKIGRNPSTGETIEIPAKNVPTFKFGNNVRKQVKGE